MDLRAHHERRRYSVIGILALIAQRDLVARHTRCQGALLRRFAEWSTSPRSPAVLPALARRERSILNHMNQQQDQHDQHYQAKTTTTVVADSRAHAIAAETEHQQQDK